MVGFSGGGVPALAHQKVTKYFSIWRKLLIGTGSVASGGSDANWNTGVERVQGVLIVVIKVDWNFP